MSPLGILAGNPFLTSCVLASLLALVWRFACRKQKISWAPVFCPLVWSFLSKFLLGVSAILLPVTLDRYLYAADGGFGFQPAFAGGRLLLRNPWLWRLSELCYANLPLAMALLYFLLRTRRGGKEAGKFVRFAVLLAISGYCLYFLFPAVGPAGVFHRDFPYRAPAVQVIPTAMPLIERNCMPSLHTAWIIAMLWSGARLAAWFRRALWAFSAFTLLYTVSGGGHYLVDMIVAVPFTVAVRYLARRDWRSPGFAANTALVVFWLALLRFGTGVVSLPAVLYPLTFATMALAYASGRLDRRQAALRPEPTTQAGLLPVEGA